jgi:hypothetical protein
MSENLLLLVWVAKITLVVICAILYRLGGQYNKAIRRFLMPVIYFLGVWGISVWLGVFNPWMFISLPLFIGALSMGYGADDFWKKVQRRLIYGVCLSLSFLPFGFIFGGWIIYVFHCILCISGCIVFGVANPFKNAVTEEALLGLIATLLPIMMI